MVEKIKGDIYLVPGRRGGHYPHCNSIFIDSDGRAVIDPGSHRKALRELGERGVETALLSHFHSDHIRDLRELPEARIFIHSSEQDALAGWEKMSPFIWFPEETPDQIWIGRKDREVGGWGWDVSGTFTGGDEIIIGDVRVVVIHAPGHTVGHCCFWFPEEKILFSADVDFTDFGPWYGNACSGVKSFKESIELLKNYRPEVTVTGHEAGLIEGDLERRLDIYGRVIDLRHERILEFIREPRTLNEVTAQAFVYGEFYSKDNTLHDPEWRMVRHHLEWAVERGEAVLDGGAYRAL